MKIGRTSGASYFNRLVDEVRVSNTAVYTSNFTPQMHLTTSANTMGLWKFDGQTAADSSTNGNNGTLQGGAVYSGDVPSGDGGGGGSGGGGVSQIQWLVADHLGTPRMIFDQTGNLATMKRHDYLPFGEELFAPAGARSVAMGYSGGDGVRQQFTSKERDIETGLDYFLARYYSSTQGRFTSPDEFTGGPDELYYFAEDASDNPTFYADLRKPQSLNKYQYSYNNPLRWVDPDGHDPEEPEPPQDPRPVVPLPPIPGAPPLVVPGSPASTPKGPTDAEIIEGAQNVLDTVADYTGITWLADKIRPFCPKPTPATTTPPTQNQQPLPPPGPIQASGQERKTQDFTPSDKRKVDAKSGGKCADCGRDVRPVQNTRGVPTPADQRQVHHKKPKSQGGTRDLNNAVPLCPSCHKERHRKMREGNAGTL